MRSGILHLSECLYIAVPDLCGPCACTGLQRCTADKHDDNYANLVLSVLQEMLDCLHMQPTTDHGISGDPGLLVRHCLCFVDSLLIVDRQCAEDS